MLLHYSKISQLSKINILYIYIRGYLRMIHWNYIQPIFSRSISSFHVPTLTSVNAPILQYLPFGTTTARPYISHIIPSGREMTSISNSFNDWFNISLPPLRYFSLPTFSNFKFPTLSFTNMWNNFKVGASSLYNSTKSVASSALTDMKDFASRIISGAKKYIGYNRADGSYKKFTDGRDEKWCADFATYVARENGSNIPHFSGVSDILKWGNDNNRFSTKAKPGDIIIFKGVNKKGKQVSHTGIVEKVENGRVYTIEGNSSNKVATRNYALNDSQITGYVSVA